MAFSVGGGGQKRRGRVAQATVAEINVTPLVDVMLVLLVIFMTASSVETARLSREAETLRQVVSDEMTAADAAPQDENQVPVDLPKAKAEKLVGGAKSGKPVLSIDRRRRIYLGKDLLVDCRKVSGKFEACLDAFEKALSTNEKAQSLTDVHLRADQRLSYGQVLQLMARMRRAGISHFGLVTEVPAGSKGRAP
ncbi:MAG: biopolymer transporter ExbD [Myxococcales bacterium]|nr:biopolymer transporter ExbD [Myxococcales bacterium]